MTDLIGFVAIVTSVLRSWPQAWKVVRVVDPSGVSALTWSLASGCHLSWVIFGLQRDLFASWVGNAAILAGCSSVLGSLVLRGVPGVLPKAFAVVGFTAVGDLALSIFVGPDGVGTVALTLALVMFIPQAAGVIAGGVSGVSVTSWIMILISTLAWGAYGLVERQPLIFLTTIVIAPCSIVIIARLRTLETGSRPTVLSAPYPVDPAASATTRSA